MYYQFSAEAQEEVPLSAVLRRLLFVVLRFGNGGMDQSVE
jgi:hypothetical protein